jgi:hypothetical protein
VASGKEKRSVAHRSGGATTRSGCNGGCRHFNESGDRRHRRRCPAASGGEGGGEVHREVAENDPGGGAHRRVAEAAASSSALVARSELWRPTLDRRKRG